MSAGCHLRFSGQIAHNLIVQKNSHVVLHGSILGLVLNDGGILSLAGVAGLVTDLEGCRSFVGQAPADSASFMSVRAYLASIEAPSAFKADIEVSIVGPPKKRGYRKGLNAGWNADSNLRPSRKRMTPRAEKLLHVEGLAHEQGWVEEKSKD